MPRPANRKDPKSIPRGDGDRMSEVAAAQFAKGRKQRVKAFDGVPATWQPKQG